MTSRRPVTLMRRPSAVAGMVAAAALLASMILPASAAFATDEGELPVPYQFPVPFALATLQPDVDPPGANDWNCKPTVAHPNPVVLLHGFFGNKANNWQTMSPLLKNNGSCVFSLTYGATEGTPPPINQIGGMGVAIEDAAAQVGEFVDRVRTATGAAKVDFLGHSYGTFMPQYYLQFLGGAQYVDKYVALAPFYDGFQFELSPALELLRTIGLYDQTHDLVKQFAKYGFETVAGSDYVRRMHEAPGGPAVPGVTYTSVMSRVDNIVVPYTSGWLDGPNATNIVIQDGCPIDFGDHFAMPFTRRVGQIVLNALDPAHKKRPPCELVLPLVGSQLIPWVG